MFHLLRWVISLVGVNECATSLNLELTGGFTSRHVSTSCTFKILFFILPQIKHVYIQMWLLDECCCCALAQILYSSQNASKHAVDVNTHICLCHCGCLVAP